MQKFNYHTHTVRCGHAKGTDEEYVLAAIEAGYEILGFSDHAPYRTMPAPRARMDWEYLEDYISSITALQEKYRDRIQILLGLETEYFEVFREEKEYLRSRVDYMILGQHFKTADGQGSYFAPNTPEEMAAYADNICAGLETGLFSYVCHPDVFMFSMRDFNQSCQDASRQIIEKCAQLDIPLEVNVHNVYKGKTEFANGQLEYVYPHKDFWRIAAEYPVRCLFGVDAHKPEQLLDRESIIKAEEELSDLNLNFITEPFRF